MTSGRWCYPVPHPPQIPQSEFRQFIHSYIHRFVRPKATKGTKEEISCASELRKHKILLAPTPFSFPCRSHFGRASTQPRFVSPPPSPSPLKSEVHMMQPKKEQLMEDRGNNRRPPGSMACLECKRRWDIYRPRWCCVHAMRRDWQEKMCMSWKAMQDTRCEGCSREKTDTLVAWSDPKQRPYCHQCWVAWWDAWFPIGADAEAMKGYCAVEAQLRQRRLV